MDSVQLYEKAPYILGGLVALSAAVVLKKFMKKPKVYNDPPNTVILCSLPRGPRAPCMSMFPMKLETYLRVAKIPHKVVTDRGFSPKNKTPYIMFNGETISDSQLCIEYLNKKFDVDLDQSLNAEQRAMSRALRKMMEEGFYWNFVLERWAYGDKTFLVTAFKHLFKFEFLARRGVNYHAKILEKYAYGQGMGRHTPEEVRDMGLKDLQAASDFLGKKPYFMGDKMTEVDCSLFGFLCQCRYHFPGTIYEKAVMKDYPNLDAFIERMKSAYWQDWDDCITNDGTKTALK